MDVCAREGLLPTVGVEAIDDAADLGFDGIELNGLPGADPSDHPAWTSEGRTALRRRANERGIDLPSVSLSFLNGRGSLADDDPAERAAARHVVLRAIDAAAALGAPVVLVPFFGAAAVETDEEEARAVDGLSRLADAAAAAGVRLAVENALSVDRTVAILDAIGHPAVGAYYDTGNVQANGEDPAAAVERLGDRIAGVHLKDVDADGGSVMLGEGVVDFGAVAAALREVGYDGPAVLETPSPGDPREDARANLSAARAALEG